jgi:hypothetical protein
MGGLALGRLMPIDWPGTEFREPEEFTDLETVEGNRLPWMFQYPVVGNPWQPSAALGAPNQAVSGGLYPTSQDPLDSERESYM